MDRDTWTLLLFASSCAAIAVYYARRSRRIALLVGTYLILVSTIMFLARTAGPSGLDKLTADPTEQSNPVLLRVFDRPSDPPQDQINPFQFPRRDHRGVALEP